MADICLTAIAICATACFSLSRFIYNCTAVEVDSGKARVAAYEKKQKKIHTHKVEGLSEENWPWHCALFLSLSLEKSNYQAIQLATKESRLYHILVGFFCMAEFFFFFFARSNVNTLSTVRRAFAWT